MAAFLRERGQSCLAHTHHLRSLSLTPAFCFRRTPGLLTFIKTYVLQRKIPVMHLLFAFDVNLVCPSSLHRDGDDRPARSSPSPSRSRWPAQIPTRPRDRRLLAAADLEDGTVEGVSGTLTLAAARREEREGRRETRASLPFLFRPGCVCQPSPSH